MPSSPLCFPRGACALRFLFLAILTAGALCAQTPIINSLAGGADLGDGGAANMAWLYSATGVALDAQGNLYIADAANHRIRKVDYATGIISSVAGIGLSGFAGENGPAALARLYYPKAVAVDAAGNLYISDTENQRIRKVDAATGFITTIAGNGTAGYTGDNGPATAATLRSPYGLAVNAAGTEVYFADTGNNVVRKIAAGQISRVTGSATGQGGNNSSTDPLLALLSFPQGVAVDSAGAIYIADTGNQKIRKVAGTAIAVVAGGGTADPVNGGLATLAQLTWPTAVAVDAGNNLYIADHMARKVLTVDTGTGFISAVAYSCGNT